MISFKIQRRRLLYVNVSNRPEKTNALPTHRTQQRQNKCVSRLRVDSGAYINAISETDAEKTKHFASKCIIYKAPPPTPKVEYANAELEQPLATNTMRFKIGDYTSEETFIFMNQTSFPIIRLAFLRKHAAILDTPQRTLDFPKIQITMALTDEIQKCNPMPVTIKTESKHTIPVQSTRIKRASIPVSNDHPITGTIQPQFDKLPQFDVWSTHCSKRVTTKIANTTDFPYTINPNTKLAELQILKPEETKMIRPVHIVALNMLTDQDDVVTYINALMQVEQPEDKDEKF